jgi:hypothetical protein
MNSIAVLFWSTIAAGVVLGIAQPSMSAGAAFVFATATGATFTVVCYIVREVHDAFREIESTGRRLIMESRPYVTPAMQETVTAMARVAGEAGITVGAQDCPLCRFPHYGEPCPWPEIERRARYREELDALERRLPDATPAARHVIATFRSHDFSKLRAMQEHAARQMEEHAGNRYDARRSTK